MSAMKRRRGSFFVGDHALPTAGAGLSYAQTLASAWARTQGEDRSFYVRDALDNVVHRVDVIGRIVYTPRVKEVKAA